MSRRPRAPKLISGELFEMTITDRAPAAESSPDLPESLPVCNSRELHGSLADTETPPHPSRRVRVLCPRIICLVHRDAPPIHGGSRVQTYALPVQAHVKH